MKIGIVTQPLFANYGGFLQNYALQQVLKRMGHEPITIDYFTYRSFNMFMLLCLKLLIQCLMRKRGLSSLTSILKINKRNKQNEAFVQKYISVTEPIGKYRSELIYKYKLSAVIVGSDQVWRPKYNAFVLNKMFLSFVKKGIKKIAYAASFGTDNWEFTNRQTKECNILAKQFQAISVRENSGIELCKKHLDVEAVEVLDPTLLLNKEDYIELCKNVPISTEQYLAAYVLDVDDKKIEFIQKIADNQHLPVKIFSADNAATLTIEEWISMFRDASYIITDSFHGTVFSIIFNKPFISIGNSNRGLSRFRSLLDKLGLSARLVDETTLVSYSYNTDNIEWKSVNKKREILRTDSINFLFTALKL